jgi:hypothetical protein
VALSMAAIAPPASRRRVSLRDDARDVATTILAGSAADAVSQSLG